MATNEDAVIKDAIAGTEKEIFNEAFSDAAKTDTDDGAEPDTSLEDMEELPGSDVDAKGEDGDEAGEADTGKEEQQAQGKGDGEAEQGEQPGTTKPPRDAEGKFAAKDGKSGDGEQKAGEQQGQAKADQQQQQRRGDPTVPLAAERQRRQTAEAERDQAIKDRDTAKTEFAKLEGKLDLTLKRLDTIEQRGSNNGGQQQQQRQDASENQAPDIFTDPEGYRDWSQKQVETRVSAAEQRMSERFINASFGRAHEQQGKAFETAYSALVNLDRTNPVNVALVRRVRDAADPGGELMRWHKNQLTLAEVGPDPQAYVNRRVEEAIAAKMKDPEFRKQMFSDMQAEARGDGETNNGGGRPRTIIRNPRSLNSQGGRAEHVSDAADSDGSNQAIFDAAFT